MRQASVSAGEASRGPRLVLARRRCRLTEPLLIIPRALLLILSICDDDRALVQLIERCP